MNYRRLAALVGAAALGVGLLAIAAPGVVAVGLDRTVVTVLGIAILAQAVRVVQRRRRGARDEATTPDPERPFATAPPGEDLEDALESFLETRLNAYRRSSIREGLRSAAVAVLVQYGTYTEADAEAAVAAGTWTDDRAAAFLGDGRSQTSSVRSTLRKLVSRGSGSGFRRDVRHAVDAIAAAAGVAVDDGEASEAETPERDSDRDPRDREHRATTKGYGSGGGDRDDGGAIDGTAIVRDAHETGHWRGVSVVALVGLGVGVLVKRPAVLLAGVVGIGFAAYARSSALAPESYRASVSVERTLETERPEPDEDVEVTVTVTNESDRFLPDLRFVDGVPEALAVADGSPQFATALRSGESATFTYAVAARRGVHEFGPTLLVERDLTGAVERERLLPATATALTCVPSLRPLPEPIPLRQQAARSAGRVETESGGEGLEFHATREYRPGDAMNRIDWNRRARTGELTTIEFREEDAATVVVVIDARAAAAVSPTGRAPHAVDRAVDAAGRIFATATRAGDRVGIAALGSESCWLAPGAGPEHRLEARELLATHPALASVPDESPLAAIRGRRRLRERLSAETQVLFLTPLCDDDASDFARRLEAYGHPVTVISLDPTAARTPGHRLSRVSRRLRISALRSAGIPVVEWSWDESIDVALARSDAGWST